MVRLKVKIEKRKGQERKFQFQYGTIKRVLKFCNFRPLQHFNSSMVRLKVKQESYDLELEFDFNSSMVRLKDRSSSFTLSEFKISIPVWYD